MITEVQQSIETVEIHKTIDIAAPIEIAFGAMLDELGPEATMMKGTAMHFTLEAWPGGRWYRDLGNNAGHLAGGACVNGADEGVWMWTTNEGRVKHARRDNVVDEARLAGQQSMIFNPRDAGSDLIAHRPSLVMAFLARSSKSFGVL